MQRAKSVIAFMFPVVIWGSVTGVEYDVAIHLGLLFSTWVCVLASFALLGDLLWAPEGFEDQSGFHVGVPAGLALL